MHRTSKSMVVAFLVGLGLSESTEHPGKQPDLPDLSSTRQRCHSRSEAYIDVEQQDVFRAIDGTPISFSTQIWVSSRSVPRVSSTTEASWAVAW